MSNHPTTGSGELRSSDAQDTANPISFDPLTARYVLRSKSGKIYYTSTEVLVTCSPIFRDLVECCDEVEHVRGRGLGNRSPPARKKLEIHLEDSDDEIETLLEHLHHTDTFITSVVPVTTEGAAKIVHLAAIAFKYDMQGKK
jgi:hypothetical protein